MKNYFKKFSIMFMMVLTIIGIGMIYGVSGANAATVGQQLSQKEDDTWKRIDDTNSKLKYFGTWDTINGSYWSDSTIHYTVTPNSDVDFEFYGSKLRLIASVSVNCVNKYDNKLIIDGKHYDLNQNYSNSGDKILVFEVSGLNKTSHSVQIKNLANKRLYLDALDIDADGEMLTYNDSISLNKSSMDLSIESSEQLISTTTPEAVEVTWASSDSSIATVDSTGKVTGIKEGTCTITATIDDGSKVFTTCAVNVTKENKSISLNKSTTNLTIDDSETLIATTTPAGISVKWSSSDTSVATVDSNGKVTAIGAGTATITATTLDGSNLSATCTVTVTKKDDPQPTDPTGDANLLIELVDGQIKQYTVSQDEINKFTSWFENRDKDHSLTATYKFTKGTYKDYVVHDQIDWFEVR
ncbi:Ig-like domain-containing protein [Clostridium saccharoperbutylacetonicum]|uniref:Ig-like domain-containing protein n=1 Tax=Clostridium saccharoperbutylacetonicum TaxID=36745 RepID=UPI000983BA5F|nr:Ig-like domain-containing protein [Clostridium saccharoperbutylacetonicum]AQR95581.1 bacterial Ig-like domain protein [Clostridium saccharoperbutylacetonicum]NSB31441.1 uncharacterized protein YjdB [Clostridium saccharoperbutylacetonicum]